MVKHISLSSTKFARSRILKQKIDSGEISLGGNLKLKIYGTLTCASGKRMKTENRVFFQDENEAISNGFRPCGHCMRDKYLNWKNLENKITQSQITQSQITQSQITQSQLK